MGRLRKIHKCFCISNFCKYNKDAFVTSLTKSRHFKKDLLDFERGAISAEEMEESWNYSAATCENELERNFLTDEYDSNEVSSLDGPIELDEYSRSEFIISDYFLLETLSFKLKSSISNSKQEELLDLINNCLKVFGEGIMDQVKLLIENAGISNKICKLYNNSFGLNAILSHIAESEGSKVNLCHDFKSERNRVNNLIPLRYDCYEFESGRVHKYSLTDYLLLLFLDPKQVQLMEYGSNCYRKVIAKDL
jgi:hypothetical protein